MEGLLSTGPTPSSLIVDRYSRVEPKELFLQIFVNDPSPRPPSRPPKIILDILTLYFYCTLKRQARDGLGVDLTCAQVVNKCVQRKPFYVHFFMSPIYT